MPDKYRYRRKNLMPADEGKSVENLSESRKKEIAARYLESEILESELKAKEEKLAARKRKLEEEERKIKEEEKLKKKKEKEKKRVLLRLAPSLWEDLNRIADTEFRSINAQIEYFLTEAVRQRKGGD